MRKVVFDLLKSETMDVEIRSMRKIRVWCTDFDRIEAPKYENRSRKRKKSRFDCRLARYPNEIGRNAINRMHGSMSIAKIDFQFSLAGRAIITRGYYQTNYT